MAEQMTTAPEYLDNDGRGWGWVRADLAPDGQAAKDWAMSFCGSDQPAEVSGPFPMRLVDPEHPDGELWDVCPPEEGAASYWKVEW